MRGDAFLNALSKHPERDFDRQLLEKIRFVERTSPGKGLLRIRNLRFFVRAFSWRWLNRQLMKTHRTESGTVFFDFHHADAPLLHSLFGHVMAHSALGMKIFERFCAANYATFYIYDSEQPGFSALVHDAVRDISEERGMGGHDEKIGSERETELLLEILERLLNLIRILPMEGHVD